MSEWLRSESSGGPSSEDVERKLLSAVPDEENEPTLVRVSDEAGAARDSRKGETPSMVCVRGRKAGGGRDGGLEEAMLPSKGLAMESLNTTPWRRLVVLPWWDSEPGPGSDLGELWGDTDPKTRAGGCGTEDELLLEEALAASGPCATAMRGSRRSGVTARIVAGSPGAEAGGRASAGAVEVRVLLVLAGKRVGRGAAVAVVGSAAESGDSGRGGRAGMRADVWDGCAGRWSSESGNCCSWGERGCDNEEDGWPDELPGPSRSWSRSRSRSRSGSRPNEDRSSMAGGLVCCGLGRVGSAQRRGCIAHNRGIEISPSRLVLTVVSRGCRSIPCETPSIGPGVRSARRPGARRVRYTVRARANRMFWRLFFFLCFPLLFC